MLLQTCIFRKIALSPSEQLHLTPNPDTAEALRLFARCHPHRLG